MKFDRIKSLLLLHLLLLIYSVGTIFSKIAATQSFLSLTYCLCYAGIIFLLLFYAFFWQQIIKKLPLTLAYANKSVTVVWGILWGFLFFQESITIGKLVGALLIVAGVTLFAFADKEESND